MNITLIQPDIHWENPDANLSCFEKLFLRITGKTDLVILPEMFTTGFTMRSEEYCLPPENQVVDWMKKQAAALDAALTGSLIIKENDQIYNRLYFVDPDGIVSHYNKRHLFRMGGEGDHFHQGTKRNIISYRGWRIFPLICYDLRFPVWSRNLDDYDLLIYLANWPAVRSDVWNTLLKARAIENQSFVAAVNRVGLDGEGIIYTGESQVIDPKGQIILKLGERETIQQIDLSLEDLSAFRKKFPAWKDRDNFVIYT